MTEYREKLLRQVDDLIDDLIEEIETIWKKTKEPDKYTMKDIENDLDTLLEKM